MKRTLLVVIGIIIGLLALFLTYTAKVHVHFSLFIKPKILCEK
jgi:hypothetical protein